MVIVVSEETGIISIVLGGKIERSLDGDSLKKSLASIFEGRSDEEKVGQPVDGDGGQVIRYLAPDQGFLRNQL